MENISSNISGENFANIAKHEILNTSEILEIKLKMQQRLAKKIYGIPDDIELDDDTMFKFINDGYHDCFREIFDNESSSINYYIDHPDDHKHRNEILEELLTKLKAKKMTIDEEKKAVILH